MTDSELARLREICPELKTYFDVCDQTKRLCIMSAIEALIAFTTMLRLASERDEIKKMLRYALSPEIDRYLDKSVGTDDPLLQH